MLKTDEVGSESDPYDAFEHRVRRESILFGPLSDTVFRTLAIRYRKRTVREIHSCVRRLQYKLAVRLLCLTTRAFCMLPADCRRRVYSFAFTPRARHGHPSGPTASESLPMAFTVFAHPDSAPLHCTGFISVPSAATLNDVCSLIHCRLWELFRGQDVQGWRCDDSLLFTTTVRLMMFPWRYVGRHGMVPPYVYQAHRFQPYVAKLERKSGFPHVVAMAFQRQS